MSDLVLRRLRQRREMGTMDQYDSLTSTTTMMISDEKRTRTKKKATRAVMMQKTAILLPKILHRLQLRRVLN